MAVRKMIQQVGKSVNIQLFPQQVAFLRAYAFEVLDGRL
jgi:hypothetical protein